jgi:hypothetical protein
MDRGFYSEPMLALNPEVRGAVYLAPGAFAGQLGFVYPMPATDRAFVSSCCESSFFVACLLIGESSFSSLMFVVLFSSCAAVPHSPDQVVSDWHTLGGTALGTSRGGFVREKVRPAPRARAVACARAWWLACLMCVCVFMCVRASVRLCDCVCVLEFMPARP